MSDVIHLEVVQGEDKGKTVSLPDDGARIGRSSKSDVVLADPLLSRHHCRAYFSPQGDLWLADLGSANQTIVNGVTIQDIQLHIGDRITLGDTVMRVVNDKLAPLPEKTGVISVEAPAAGGPVVDLGLSDAPDQTAQRKFSRGTLIAAACIAIAAAAIVWTPWAKVRDMIWKEQKVETQGKAAKPPVEPMLLEYEKVEADTENIFRYALVITPDDKVAVEMDDLANNRHVNETKQLDRDQVEALTREIEDAGFFSLDDEYRGVEPKALLKQWDMRVTIGHKTHACRVINRVEPKLFRQIRERIETFGKTELDLWATQFPTEKLLEMAHEAFVLAKKLYTEREVKYGNLAAAVRSLREAKFNLESVEEKPDYFGQVLTLIEDCEDELERKYEEYNFRAMQAMNNHQWRDADRELRVLLEMIPDGEDERNREARNRLLEVQTRLQQK